ncbi:MAG TPA: oxidative damage protection protein [Longimicrobiales bacterium]
MAGFQCVRCGEDNPRLERPPLRNELGERVQREICKRCWDQWLRYQTALINHYGLDVRERPAREFLTANMEAFLFRSGSPEQIDTSQQGTVSW